jgi:hypothetical protein
MFMGLIDDVQLKPRTANRPKSEISSAKSHPIPLPNGAYSNADSSRTLRSSDFEALVEGEHMIAALSLMLALAPGATEDD